MRNIQARQNLVAMVYDVQGRSGGFASTLWYDLCVDSVHIDLMHGNSGASGSNYILK
jgi:hypothetical protein